MMMSSSGVEQEYSTCVYSQQQQKEGILGNMDNLWFHKAIIFNQLPLTDTSSSSNSSTSASSFSSSMTMMNSISSLSSDDQEMSHPLGFDVEQEDEALNEDEEEDGEISVGEIHETPNSWPDLPRVLTTTTTTTTAESNSSSSSKSTPTHRHHHHHRRHRHLTLLPQPPPPLRVLDRTLSSKTFAELEEEEVKGFMDLGFNFEKHRLTPRIKSILPGLQRLEIEQKSSDVDDHRQETRSDVGKVAAAAVNNRRKAPYLSEAWTIERPDSPLLRMRMPTAFSAPDDMKRLLKVWVKTVAVAVRD